MNILGFSLAITATCYVFLKIIVKLLMDAGYNVTLLILSIKEYFLLKKELETRKRKFIIKIASFDIDKEKTKELLEKGGFYE